MRRAHARSFAEFTQDVGADVASPICRKQSTFYKFMETAVRPISDTLYESVLYGIVMDVVDMAREVVIIPNCVLPKSPLPDSLFAFSDLT